MEKSGRRNTILIVFIFIALFAATAFLLVNWIKSAEVFNFVRPFTVEVTNDSEYDIVSLEFGLLKGESKETLDKIIASGSKARFIPNLDLTSENAVYLKFRDARGEGGELTVCGYTEYLNGMTRVRINEKEAVVEEMDCF
ncbi:hypothetical protein M6D81_04435 [Paenibacillus sp. J5C_2022]|uniref:hypothetical protein n=1 Tax=Paenibacillus sp. J5C2022 TaxID=2977129 RepID=UPI0021D3CC10|nr:hypothetical protein [Paenibacillus sp. J5C2022]MCU6707953.1 hypothetical protein [Paenibacillus sp. J5C2022]